MVNAVIYSRVSSVGNRQDTVRQTNELTEYAARMGYNLVGIYEEKISGFKKNEDRPILSQMLKDIDRGKIDKVLTWELSRIGRNVIQGLSFVEELNTRKVSLFIKNYNLETLYEDKSINPLTMFLVQILASIAAMESDATKSRFQSGYRNYINNGGKVGRKPGHTISDEDLLKKYSEVVKLLKRGLSLRQVSKLTENTSTTTVMKVKATIKRLQEIS
ncbi:recombinase family protein [Aquirufa lenticrescens]|uniref:recombinase family protein n=1 Tax=Aquirufa lenticrescens TaxID=2696560 RepID=UPI001CAA47F2|nr:recombinase family protein [Aquirufa lenticrescens]UAJ13618.1 recombinase family protein [Aquirufa lenticrescens]